MPLLDHARHFSAEGMPVADVALLTRVPFLEYFPFVKSVSFSQRKKVEN
jgi:hypothetical protein